MFELRGSVYIQGPVNRMWADCIGKTSLTHLSLAQNETPVMSKNHYWGFLVSRLIYLAKVVTKLKSEFN